VGRRPPQQSRQSEGEADYPFLYDASAHYIYFIALSQLKRDLIKVGAEK
jgi:hypothetical protein